MGMDDGVSDSFPVSNLSKAQLLPNIINDIRVFENRILRRILGPKREESDEGSTMRNFIVCTVLLI